MKQLTRIGILFFLATLFTSASSAKWTDNQFGLSDSCWQVFLAQLSGDDSSFGDLYESAGTIDTQIDSMMKLLPGLRGKAVKNLQKQIIALRKQRIAVHKQLKSILKANVGLLLDIRKHCGRDTTITDTTDTTGGGGPDTTGGGGPDTVTIGLNPNPVLVGGSTNLTFTLAAPANVTVNVFSQTTATLVQTFSFPGLPAGPQALLLNLSSLPPGSYLIQVQAGTSVGTATLLIL